MRELQGPHLTPVPIRNRRVWRDLAKILSTIFNPFITAIALFVILAHVSQAAAPPHTALQFWKLLFLSTSFTSIGPMLFIFWLYAADRISDLDMSVREEREKVFGVFVIFYLLGTVTLWITQSPRLLIATMAGYTLSTIVVQYITRYWKISTHSLGITAPLVVLCYLYGREPLPFLVLIPAIWWARVYLKAHTFGQVIAGSALAAASVTFFFWVFHVRSTLW